MKKIIENLKIKKEESLESLREIKKNIENKINEKIEKLNKTRDLVKEWLSKKIFLKNKKFRVWFFDFISHSNVRHILSAPFIYMMIIPAIFLDFFLEIYHRICFFSYKIPFVKRWDYIVFDRRHLSYLNWFEKFNCIYCSYFNWLLAYAKEIAGRTERYWCPIKHAKNLKDPHSQYEKFNEYLDWEKYKEKLKKLRCFDKKN